MMILFRGSFFESPIVSIAAMVEISAGVSPKTMDVDLTVVDIDPIFHLYRHYLRNRS